MEVLFLDWMMMIKMFLKEQWIGLFRMDLPPATYHILTPYPGTRLYQIDEARGQNSA